MRKYLFILVIFFCSYQTGNCQHIFPTYTDSAKWDVYACFMGMSCQTSIYKYSYDTVFCGKAYSKTVLSGYLTTGVGFVRSDSIRSYCRASTNCLDKEYLMYDYSMNPGDSIYAGLSLMPPFAMTDTTKFVLTSIDTVNFLGKNRRVFHMLFNPNGTGVPNRPMNWIEGIGSTTHPFHSMVCLQDGCETSFRLLCYDSSSVQLYQDTVYNTCDSTFYAGLYDYNNPNINLIIFPIPATDKIEVCIQKSDLRSLEIFNVQGQKIKSIINNKPQTKNEIDISELVNGVYIIEVNTENNIIRQKFVKQ